MGGCRCTYKNCTVRSDGKTHLFHYPVFDKIRCHEWLSRAGRYDFLKLKVSQLKNRCICQHHFADNCFMNETKEKLKLKAVPSLDGPFCDSSKFKDPEISQNMYGVYPLVCEVENDDIILDRKSNYNLVYADFLTNSDVALESMKYNLKEEDTKNYLDIENVTPTTNNNIAEIDCHLENAVATGAKTKLNSKSMRDCKVEVVIPSLRVEQNNENISNTVKVEAPLIPVQQKNMNVSNMSAANQPKKNRVRIISEKKITEPGKKISVPISAASFEIVKPSMILNLSNIKSQRKSGNIGQSNNANESPILLNNPGTSQVIEIREAPNNDKEDPFTSNIAPNACPDKDGNITELLKSNAPYKFEIDVNLNEVSLPPKSTPDPNFKKTTTYYNVNNQITPDPQFKRIPTVHNVKNQITPHPEVKRIPTGHYTHYVKNQITPHPEVKRIPTGHNVKNQITPERVAAIHEKRKFNMKVKDIIAEELSRLDEQGSSRLDTSLIPHSSKKNMENNEAGTETVLSSLSKDPSLPNEHAYIVHYLEARMEKMENLLLNKIDQNTRKIITLQKSLDPQEPQHVSKKSSAKKKPSAKEQNEHKRQLYDEISKYLSPSSKSLIYEELFINIYNPNESKSETTPPKRKRTRR